MALEPTEEQVNTIAAGIVQCVMDDQGYESTARRLWPIIRDMVLEKAGKVCDAAVGELVSDWDYAASTLGDRIRSLKG